MSTADRDDLAILLLRASGAVTERVNSAVAATVRAQTGGRASLRPAHGLVLVLVSRGDATVSGLAGELGITKQSAAVIVEQLARAGILDRRPHPTDRRAQVLALTPAGIAVTRAAADAVRSEWRALVSRIGPTAARGLVAGLEVLGQDGTLRPVW